MNLFGKKTVEKRSVPSRITKMSNHDLTSWANTTIMSLGRAFDDWRYREGPPEAVTESLDSLTLIWHELMDRGND